MKDIEEEGREYLKFARAELVDMISDYGDVRPAIADEIRKHILETKNQKVERAFDRIVNFSKILRTIYKASPTRKSKD